MVVSRRSGKRPPRWAARLQARVGSGSASPPRFEPTVLASPRSLSQFGLARLVSAGRRARCCHAEGAPVGAIGPNFGGTLDRCRSVPGSATQAKPTGSGARTHGAFRQLPLRRCCTAASGGRLTEAQECEAAPRFMTKSHVKVVLQGNRDHTVRIIGMRAVKYCQPPLAGTIFDSPPAGAEESEWIGFDLDSSDTSARPRDRQSRAGISTRHYFEAKTISLKPGEQEVLQVLAKTWKYYCQYRIEMTVLDGSKTTTQMISNGDQPFQVTGVMVTDDHGINRIAYSRYRAVYLGGVNSPLHDSSFVRKRPATVGA
jgi:hypothetical protein